MGSAGYSHRGAPRRDGLAHNSQQELGGRQAVLRGTNAFQGERKTMPAAQTHSEARRSPAKKTAAKKSAAKKTAAPDAIQLLKQDHREVEAMFEQFEKSRSDDKKVKLAHQICIALKVHTQI